MSQRSLGRLGIPREDGAEDPGMVATGGLDLGEAHPVPQPTPVQPAPGERGPVEQIDEDRISRCLGDGAVKGVIRILERGAMLGARHRRFRPAYPLEIPCRGFARGKPRQLRLESEAGREKMPRRAIGKFAGSLRFLPIAAIPARRASLDEGAPPDLPGEQALRLQQGQALAQGCAGQSELFGQDALRRQPFAMAKTGAREPFLDQFC